MYNAKFIKTTKARDCLIGAAISMFPIHASAQTTGNALYEWCKNADEVYQALCPVYIEAAMRGEHTGSVVAGLKYFNLVALDVSDEKFEELKSLKISKLLSYCVPQEATGQQSNDIVIKYLETHPEKRHEAAEILVNASLSEAFPCPE